MEFAAAVAADREQADVFIPAKTLPSVKENTVDKIRTLVYQCFDVLTLLKAVVEAGVSAMDGVPKNSLCVLRSKIREKAFFVKKKG